LAGGSDENQFRKAMEVAMEALMEAI